MRYANVLRVMLLFLLPSLPILATSENELPDRTIDVNTTEEEGAIDVGFEPTVFSLPLGTLYAGAHTNNAKQSSLVSAQISMATPQTIKLNTLAPSDISFNGAIGTQNSPLYNQTFSALALVGASTRPLLATVKSDANTISLVNSFIQPPSVVESLDIRDCAGDIVAGINNIAGTSSAPVTIFAAVPKSSTFWREATDDTSNGIACIIADTNTSLKQTNANDISVFETPQAMPIHFTAASSPMVAFSTNQSFHAQFGSNGATDPNKVAMHWDDTLKRLFIGLSQIQPATNTANSGVISLLIAGIDADGKTPFIKPIIDNPTASILPASNQAQQIIGCGINATTNASSTLLVKTMHTSTGRDYVIVNGGTVNNISTISSVNSWIYALPIMPASDTHAGQLAVTNGTDDFILVDASHPAPIVDQTHNSPAYSNQGTFFTQQEQALVIGSDPRLLNFISPNTTTTVINDMQVVGDSVYVSITDNTNGTGLDAPRGIFRSSALFDNYGLIRSWTPWKRVIDASSFTGNCTSFGLNTKNASTLFLSGDTNETFAATSWENALGSNKVEQNIAQTFQNNGGAYRLIDFDQNTPGFKKNSFAMVIGVGGDTVTITQTGYASTDGAPTTPSVTLTAPELTAIAPLTSAAIVKANNVGYLLIGGLGGLVRVDQDNNGNGMILPDDGISSLDILPETPVFRRVGSYQNITQLHTVANQPHLCIMTTLDQAIALDATNQDNPETIIEINSEPLIFKKSFINAITSGGGMVIAATTQGIFAVKLSDGLQVTVPKLQGTPAQCVFIHDEISTSANGNMHVLAVDRDSNLGLIYRFNVADETITPIDTMSDGTTPKPYNNLEQFTHAFTTDGTTTFIARSQEVGNRTMLQAFVNTNSSTDNFYLIDDQLNITQDQNVNLFVSCPLRSSASGNWLVPGSFGLRMND